jgi:hypothetical protein
VARNPEAEQQLRAGTCVLRLGRAVTVQGLVVDPDGHPVANAKVLVGHLDEADSRQTTNRADGTFTIPGCRPGKGLISATSEGFAPATQEIEVETNAGPVRLTLQRGKWLRLAVVDRAGAPVPQAQVWLSPGPAGPAGRAVAPQIDFQRKTGPDGRLEWDGAPDRELVFHIMAPGYMRMRGVRVRPDGQEHTITLAPALTVSGTVRDAATGQLVPDFRIITGDLGRDPSNVTASPRWSALDRFWLRFHGGSFQHVYDEPVVEGPSNVVFVLKFEAEGYAPFITRPVQADEGEAHFDVVLRAAASTHE